MAAAAAAIIAGANAGLMSDYLENTIGIDNIVLRSRVVREGFTNNLDFLSAKDDKHVSKVAGSIRKQGRAVGGLMMSLKVRMRWSKLWPSFPRTRRRSLCLRLR